MSKKILDERGRLFGVINIVDVIVIILAVVLICGIYIKFGRNDRTSASSGLETVTYELEIKAVRNGISDNLRPGDKIYDQDNGVELGTIKDVEVSEAKRSEALADGTYAEGAVQDRYDVVLTIEGQCQILNGRYYVNRSDEISVNGEKKTYTKYCEFTGTIVDIEG